MPSDRPNYLFYAAGASLLAAGFWLAGGDDSATTGSSPAVRLVSTDGDGAEMAGFAVIELFTSEGCSSCPSADKLLARIDAWAAEHGAPVYAVSLHVDYWDDLGWPDPYGSAANSDRQRSYARAAGERSIYTPQMVVNGESRFVGSDAAAASRALNEALVTPAATGLTLSATRTGDGPVDVAYRVEGLTTDAVLHVALVTPNASQEVPRGENAGRTLRHVNVARTFRTVRIDPSAAGQVSLPYPDGLEGPFRVIAYVSETEAKRVVAAASATPAS